MPPVRLRVVGISVVPRFECVPPRLGFKQILESPQIAFQVSFRCANHDRLSQPEKALGIRDGHGFLKGAFHFRGQPQYGSRPLSISEHVFWAKGGRHALNWREYKPSPPAFPLSADGGGGGLKAPWRRGGVRVSVDWGGGEREWESAEGQL
jgi:hypothetical protein